MRCPDCAKMVSYDDGLDPEENSAPEVTGATEGIVHVSASYRRVLGCADCGTELKAADLDFDFDVDTTQLGPCAEDEEHEFEADETDVEPTSRQATRDRNGRPIKSARYAKTFYGITLSGNVTCMHCGQAVDFCENEEVQASGMEELV